MGHILRQIPLFNLPLGLLGGQLPLGGLEGGPGHGGGQPFPLFVPLAVQKGGEDPVDHQVGVAADGRGEVAVVGGGQAEVAQILPVVPGFHQGAEHHHGHRPLLRFSLGPVQQLLQAGAVGGLEIITQGGHQGTQGVGLFGGGLFVDPVDAGLPRPGQVLCHTLVGGQHKGLDELFALPLTAEQNRHRLALVVTHHLTLLGLQVQPAPAAAASLQHLGQSGHVLQHGQDMGVLHRQGRVLPCQQLVAVAVSHPLGGPEHGLGNPMVRHGSLPVQGQDAGQGQPVHLGVEGADTVGQGLGQHGHHLVGKVHRSAPLIGLQVQGGAGLDIVAHVGDVDSQHPVALVVLLQAHRVVKVLGCCSVDGDDGLVPQVQPPLQGGGLDKLGDRPGLLHHLRRKIPVDVVAVQDGGHGALPLVGGAEDLPQGAHRGVAVAAKAGHGHRRPLPHPQVAPLGGHLDQAGQTLAVRLEPQGPVVLLQHADDRPVGPLQHAGDLGRPTASGGVLLGNDGGYLVPVPGAPLGPGRDEAVLALLRNEKSKAAAGGLICSDQFL